MATRRNSTSDTAGATSAGVTALREATKLASGSSSSLFPKYNKPRLIPKDLPTVENSVSSWDLENVQLAMRLKNPHNPIIRQTAAKLLEHMTLNIEIARAAVTQNYESYSNPEVEIPYDDLHMDFQNFSWGIMLIALEGTTSQRAEYLVQVYGRARPGQLSLTEARYIFLYHTALNKIQKRSRLRDFERECYENDRDKDGFLTLPEFERVLLIEEPPIRLNVKRLAQDLVDHDLFTLNSLRAFNETDELIMVDARGFRRSKALARVKKARARQRRLAMQDRRLSSLQRTDSVGSNASQRSLGNRGVSFELTEEASMKQAADGVG